MNKLKKVVPEITKTIFKHTFSTEYRKCVVCGTIIDPDNPNSEFYCSDKCFNTDIHLNWAISQRINKLKGE